MNAVLSDVRIFALLTAIGGILQLKQIELISWIDLAPDSAEPQKKLPHLSNTRLFSSGSLSESLLTNHVYICLNRRSSGRSNDAHPAAEGNSAFELCFLDPDSAQAARRSGSGAGPRSAVDSRSIRKLLRCLVTPLNVQAVSTHWYRLRYEVPTRCNRSTAVTPGRPAFARRVCEEVTFLASSSVKMVSRL